MTKLTKRIDTVTELQEKLEIKKAQLMDEAWKSSNPSDVLKVKKIKEGGMEDSKQKSYMFDPLDFQQSFEYKDKPTSVSYDTLRSMARTPIISAILKTRKNQVADFAKPQADKYSTGFIVRKKLKPRDKGRDFTDDEIDKAKEIEEFLLNCGVNNSWTHDDFETFLRKITEDSLIFDQFTFEVVRNNAGELHEFFATDASTFRLADSFDDEEYDNADIERMTEREMIDGYYPSYVQIYQQQQVAEFYPWELCFGIRNPQTNIKANGYGYSELEELVTTVTSMLWSEEYNRRFFSQGSAPKGLLRFKGEVNDKQLKAFRQEFQTMVQGVQNSWKTPVVSEEVEWIDLQKSNRDMEYTQWMEYLIKIACAIYSIDPNEIGFNINSSSSGGATFESSNEQKLKHSKDKGLYPLLSFLQAKINKYLIAQIDPDYEFLFVGMNGLTISEQLDIDIKKLSNFQTVNEIRKAYNLEPVEDGGDIILNPTYTQNISMNQQQGMGGEEEFGGMEDFDFGDNVFEEDEDEEENTFASDETKENPFVKAIRNNLKR